MNNNQFTILKYFSTTGKNIFSGFYSALKISVYCIIILCASCDSGDIYPDEVVHTGISVTATFDLEHLEVFPTSYEILFGTFNDESDIPIVSTTVTKPDEGTVVNVTLSSIPEGSTSMRLSIAKSGRKTFYTLYEMKLDVVPTESMVIPQQTVDLLQYGRIQQQVFDQCITCHGGTESAAAGLRLTEDKSYEDLVDVDSERSVKKRVSPYSIGNSFLIDVLTKDLNLSYQHNTSISSLKDDDVVLLEEWIRSGANN
ncbi:MAG: hypothetical protein LBQ60_05095 [Bacteroidales bacterium]|jgi:hypothetical protein|nr:hypothetical protein [Bacteroidales bacterium]